jgi:hypothetical protein
VIGVRLEPHDATGHGGAEADGKHGAERDRDFTEDVAGMAFSDDSVDSVDYLHRLDSSVENRE